MSGNLALPSITGLCLALFCAAAGAIPPERVKLDYEMIRNGLVLGDVVETLEHDGDAYSIASELKGRGILALAGVLRRTAHGRITPEGLRPDEFHDQRGASWAVSAKFDWATRLLTQDKNGTSETLRLPASAQDPLSLAYEFAFVPPKAGRYEVTRADGRGLTVFRFTVVGTEKLATPAGELRALHISKERDGPDDKSTEIWFAADHYFLPVRVLVVEKDGTRSDQVVTHIGD